MGGVNGGVGGVVQTRGLRAAPDSPEPKGNALVWAEANGGASQAASRSMDAARLHPPCIALAAACQIHRSLCTHQHNQQTVVVCGGGGGDLQGGSYRGCPCWTCVLPGSLP